MKKIVLILLGIIVVVGIAGAAFLVPKLDELRVVVPEYQQPGELVHLEQGWTEDEWVTFHHTPQGTRMLRYEWFMALEQPCFSLFGCDLFTDPGYLGRFGFLASKAHPELNPDGLPVGFVRQEDFTDPTTDESYPVAGFTCAACHTGELHWGKYAVRIEGAPAMIELAQFQKALGLALVFTQKFPGRYGRFEKRVLGPDASEVDRAKLEESFGKLIETALAQKSIADERQIYVNQAGFARTDALTRIGNEVFGWDMQLPDNLAAANSPVRFPQLWDASWLTWVQYNSSIAHPLVRNVGESLGVKAVLQLHGADAGEFKNSVHFDGLRKLEDLLAGPAPFEGLNSPKWPGVFPALDPEKVKRGAELYRQHCQGCHRPPIEEIKDDLASEKPKYWHENKLGKRFLKVKDVKVDFIGTDPRQAMDFIGRTADTGVLNQGRVSAERGLALVTDAIVQKAYEELQLSPEERLAWNGYRDPDSPSVRAEAIYKARPLNGVWAMAPYLHNGSVPTLYDLLSPADERPDTFWTGSKRFDPVKVGFESTEIEGGYRFEVTGLGNSNEGHSFTDGEVGNGVIGPRLSPDARWALVEYLKSL